MSLPHTCSLGNWHAGRNFPDDRVPNSLHQAVYSEFERGAVGVQTQHMTSLQSFRTVLASLPSACKPDSGSAPHLATSHCAVVDSTGHVNLLAGTPASMWRRLCECASGTLEALSGPTAALGCPAASIFAAKHASVTTFDATLTVQLPDAQGALASDQTSAGMLAARAERLLTRALSNRASSVCVYAPACVPVAIGNEQLPGCSGKGQHLRVGLCLDAKEVCVHAAPLFSF